MAAIITRRQRLLDALIGVLLEDRTAVELREETTEFPPVIKLKMPLWLQGMTASTGTLVRLSEGAGFHTRDCFGIARTVIETAINICYTIAVGDEVARRAERHARQKTYRDFYRDSVIGDSRILVQYLGRPEVEDVQGLKEEIAEFSGPKPGREKNWIDLSLDDRIREAGKTFGPKVLTHLHAAQQNVYRHSSEILHGTFFGAIYFLGTSGPNPPSSPEKMLEKWAMDHFLLLQSTDVALSAVIMAFHAKYGFEFVSQANAKLTKEIGLVPFFRDGPKSKSEEGSSPFRCTIVVPKGE